MMREIEILNKLDRRRFKYAPDIRELVAHICSVYASSDSVKRKEIRESLTADFALFWFAHEMAVWAVRETSEARIREGLIAMVIENARSDARDTLFPLALLYHSASKIGANPDGLFHWAASIASPQMKDVLTEFSDRPESLRDIAKFGFKEVQRGGDFDYASNR